MNVNSSCPCCSSSMLHHLTSHRSYWFCNHCRLEMPNFERERIKKKQAIDLSSVKLQQKMAGKKIAEPVAAV